MQATRTKGGITEIDMGQVHLNAATKHLKDYRRSGIWLDLWFAHTSLSLAEMETPATPISLIDRVRNYVKEKTISMYRRELISYDGSLQPIFSTYLKPSF